MFLAPIPPIVTPAQAGVQGNLSSLALDSRLRGNDEKVDPADRV